MTKEEKYSLISQITRVHVSVSANIAEDYSISSDAKRSKTNK